MHLGVVPADPESVGVDAGAALHRLGGLVNQAVRGPVNQFRECELIAQIGHVATHAGGSETVIALTRLERLGIFPGQEQQPRVADADLVEVTQPLPHSGAQFAAVDDRAVGAVLVDQRALAGVAA